MSNTHRVLHLIDAHRLDQRDPLCRQFKQMAQFGLTKNLQQLYQRQLDERVRLWQDVSRLRLAMPETAQHYLSSYRKIQLLNDTAGDRP